MRYSQLTKALAHSRYSLFFNRSALPLIRPNLIDITRGDEQKRQMSTRRDHPSLLIGVDDFRDMVTSGACFVDKSLFIREVIDTTEKVTLITRPRRFGKTLNLSMLHHFLAQEVAARPTRGLFDHLEITQQDSSYVSEHQGQYPTIFLTLKDVQEDSFDDAIKKFTALLSRTYAQHEYLLDSPSLSMFQKRLFESTLERKIDKTDLEDSCLNLSNYLYLHHKKKAWILLDEYDTPLHHAYSSGYWEQMIGFMRSFFGAAFKGNLYLERAVITGILRVARESLFSGLNNVVSYSVLDDRYSQYFGFTEAEVETLFKAVGFKGELEGIKAWYNGYQFGHSIIYNPWSVVNCIRTDGELRPFWVNTSSNILLRKLIAQSSLTTRRAFDALLQKKPIQKSIKESITMDELEDSETGLWTLLLMSGYLKATHKTPRGGLISCQLEVPNEEVFELYQGLIRDWLVGKTYVSLEDNFYQSLLKADIPQFKEGLQALLLQVTSYHDVSLRTQEAFYHGLLLGRANLSAKTHYLKSNHESGYGRFDIAIFPKDISQPGVITELKSVDKLPQSGDRALLTSAAEDALRQIDRREYSAAFKQLGIKQVLKIGIAFSGKNFEISDNTRELALDSSETTEFDACRPGY